MTGLQPRILVVDDDPIFRAIVIQAVCALTDNIFEAGDGEEACAIMSVAPADVVVTDMNMPNRDGLELIGDIRRNWPETTIIAVTAGSRASTPDLLLRAGRVQGAAYSIQKPVRAVELLELVLLAIQRPRPAQERFPS